jgi:hypothetical protein
MRKAPARMVGAIPLDISEPEQFAQTSVAQRAARRMFGSRSKTWRDPNAFYAAGLDYLDERDTSIDPIILASGRVVVRRGKPYTIAGLANALGLSLGTFYRYEKDPKFAEAAGKLKSFVLENAIERSYGAYSGGPINQARHLGMIDATEDPQGNDRRLNIVEVRLPQKVAPPSPEEIHASKRSMVLLAANTHQKVTEAPLSDEEKRAGVIDLRFPPLNGNGKH